MNGSFLAVQSQCLALAVASLLALAATDVSPAHGFTFKPMGAAEPAKSPTSVPPVQAPKPLATALSGPETPVPVQITPRDPADLAKPAASLPTQKPDATLTASSEFCFPGSPVLLSVSTSGVVEADQVSLVLIDLTRSAPYARINLSLAEVKTLSATQTSSQPRTLQIDLSQRVPALWIDKPRATLFVQTVVGNVSAGTPLVLEPMFARARARLEQPAPGAGTANAKPPRPRVVWDKPAADDDYYSGLRLYPLENLHIDTTLGQIEVALRPDAAPATARFISDLASRGFYTGVIFHRVVPLTGDGHPFVIQTGDPTGLGSGSMGFDQLLEQSSLLHDAGVVSVARNADPNTNGSQFFICLSREGTARLDGAYTAFGRVVEGMDVVRAISRVPLLAGKDRPEQPPVIRSVTVKPAPAMVISNPFGVRTGTQPMPANSPPKPVER